MKKHYIYDYDKKQLEEFLQDDNIKGSKEELREICIEQLLYDEDADRYKFLCGVLCVKRGQ